MLIEFLNYQPFYYLIGLRMFHLLLLIPLYYLLKEVIKDIKEGI
jgi:hypothetical protein